MGKPQALPRNARLAVAVVDERGGVRFIPSTDVRFGSLATAVATTYGMPRLSLALEENPYATRTTSPYQRLVAGSQNLRDLLLPRENDFDAIFERIDWYRKTNAWVNRALLLRAQFNASELTLHAPRNDAQTRWMRDLARELRFFSFAREWFWQLRAFGQVITLWKTSPGGKRPISIECADLRAHQPRGPGASPRIVVLPGKVQPLHRLVEQARRKDALGRRAQEMLAQYPAPLVEAVRASGRQQEVDAQDLERFGYHLVYSALDRRHHEDLAFPGMYSIFGDIEMVELARAVDLNALHHYKAAILLVRLGPENPGGNDIPVLATSAQLKSLEKAIMAQARNRFPTLVGRGDVRIDFITPPVEVFTPEKYKMAVANIFDWLGIPKAAWPGQDLQGAFASAQVTLKFLEQESADERQLFRETFEEWFFQRARTSNDFEGAAWPLISFDPNALREPRIILQTAQLLWQMGVSEATVLDAVGLDGDVEASRLHDFDRVKANLGVAFVARQRPPAPPGRPATVDQPTPERQTAPQPRPST